MHWDAIAAELEWLQGILPSERNGHGEALFAALAEAAADAPLPPPAAGALIGPGPAGIGARHAAASRFVCRSAFCHNDLLSGNFLVDASSPLFHKGEHAHEAESSSSSSGGGAAVAATEAAPAAASAEPAAAAAAPPASAAGLHKHHSTDGSGRDARAGSFSSEDGDSKEAEVKGAAAAGGAGSSDSSAAAGAQSASGAGPSASSAARSAVGPPTKAVLIDYEYADTNYVGYDLANHLAEHAGFDCDWHGSFPPRSVRFDLMRLYADACARHGVAAAAASPASASASASAAGGASGGSSGGSAAGTPPSSGRVWSDEEVDVMLRWVDAFALAAHFWWGLWALVQSKFSPIDFDFEGYFGKRMQGYALHKAAMFPDAPRVPLLAPVAATAEPGPAATAAPAGSA